MPKKRYSAGYLTTDYKTIVISPDNLGVELNWMWITNRSGSAAKVEIAHVPQGSAVSEALDLINDHSLAANTYISNEVKIYASAGDVIVAKSDTADALVLTFYGIESYPAPNLGSSVAAPRVIGSGADVDDRIPGFTTNLGETY